MSRLRLRDVAIACALSCFSALTRASEYQSSPAHLAQVVDAGPLPESWVSPDRNWILLVHLRGAPSVNERIAPVITLARRQIDPRTNGAVSATDANGIGYTLVRVRDGERWRLDVPEAGLSAPIWSPDSRHFLFRRTAADGIELWAADVRTRQARAD